MYQLSVNQKKLLDILKLRVTLKAYQSDFLHSIQAYSSRVYKSWLLTRPHAQVALESSEYHSQTPTNVLQMNVSERDYAPA